eukprot:3935720-Rhodomonas_salina.1
MRPPPHPLPDFRPPLLVPHTPIRQPKAPPHPNTLRSPQLCPPFQSPLLPGSSIRDVNLSTGKCSADRSLSICSVSTRLVAVHAR